MHPNWSKFNRLKYYTFPDQTKSMRWLILKRKVTGLDTFLLCQRGRGDYVTLTFTNNVDPFKMMPSDKFDSNKRNAVQRFNEKCRDAIRARSLIKLT